MSTPFALVFRSSITVEQCIQLLFAILKKLHLFFRVVSRIAVSSSFRIDSEKNVIRKVGKWNDCTRHNFIKINCAKVEHFWQVSYIREVNLKCYNWRESTVLVWSLGRLRFAVWSQWNITEMLVSYRYRQ